MLRHGNEITQCEGIGYSAVVVDESPLNKRATDEKSMEEWVGASTATATVVVVKGETVISAWSVCQCCGIDGTTVLKVRYALLLGGVNTEY